MTIQPPFDPAEERRRLFDRLLQEDGAVQVPQTIPPRDPHKSPPLSPAQQRLWFLDRLSGGNAFYNCDCVVPVAALVDAEALERAINFLVRRHEALRTTFRDSRGQPIQVIAPSLHVPLERVDLRDRPLAERRAEGLRIATQEARRPFDLERDPLLRAKLVTIGETDHLLALTMHHIISDGWSMGILSRELMESYGAYVAGREPALPPLPIQYADFATWQHEWLRDGVIEAQLAYWCKQLADLPELALPHDRRRPAVPSHAGRFEPVFVPNDVARPLKALSHEEDATLFMSLLAAFKVVLARYSGQCDIVVGCPIANRTRRELEGLIGFFVNSLVLRTSLEGNPTFREVIRRVRHTTTEAYEHQDLPFEQLVDALRPERHGDRNPLFQVIFQLFNAPASTRREAGSDAVAPTLEVQRGSSKFDLRLDVWESPDGIRGQFEYSTELFDAETGRRMLGHWRQLLRSATRDPDKPISQLDLMSAAERRLVTKTWRAAPPVEIADAPIERLFERAVAAGPERVALDFATRTLSYRRLDEEANAVAHALRARGAPEGALVGVLLDRSPEFVVACLGILKAGCAYVPIDPGYPAARVHLMIEDAEIAILIADRDTDLDLVGVDVLAMEEIGAPRTDAPPPAAGGAERLAYVTYTSGSTGRPKGVCVPHRGIERLTRGANYVEIRPGDGVAHSSNVSFDAATFEIWGPLLNGGRVVGVARDVALSASALERAIRERHIDVLFITTALFEQHVGERPNMFQELRYLMIGGSAATPDRFARIFQGRPPDHVYNIYGPTENTTFSTFHELDGPPAVDRILPIGRPISGTTIAVLDEDLAPVPIGVPGELVLGGTGLARSYWRRDDLTQSRFVSVDLGDGPTRVYRTGDRVRWTNEGEILFLGRRDDQVKLRGFRVEPGEIQATLNQSPLVASSVVLVSDSQQVVAYVVPAAVDDGSTEGGGSEALVADWRTIYDEVIYAQGAPSGAEHDPTFNIAGWTSSYTLRPIDAGDMREQVEGTTAVIERLGAARVLEIGVGTGLLLFRLAPRAERYVGTDFSKTALDHIEAALPRSAVAPGVVELLEREADDFSGIEAASFDVVVLNSIVQYFPDLEYLEKVIAGAVRALRPGGHIVLGDVRSLSLLDSFYLSLELTNAPRGLGADDVRRRMAARHEQEQELAVHARYFQRLVEEFPEISGVRIEPKRGRRRNELSQYRFDVTLRVGPSAPDERPATVRDWETQLGSRSSLRDFLSGRAPHERARVTGIPNARLARDAACAAALQSGAAELKSIERAGRELEDTGVEPEDLWELAREFGRVAIVSFSADDSYRLDAEFAPPPDRPEVFLGTSRAAHGDDPDALATRPVQGRFLRRIVPGLRAFLQARLPDYMHPSAYVPLKSLPLTANGKIDTAALPAPNSWERELEDDFVRPADGLEQRLASVLGSVLDIEAVGARANFFTDLGGNSLQATQVVSRIREQLHVELPLREIFAAPTVQELARKIASLGADAEDETTPAITRAPTPETTLDVDELSEEEIEDLLADLTDSGAEPR